MLNVGVNISALIENSVLSGIIYSDDKDRED